MEIPILLVVVAVIGAAAFVVARQRGPVGTTAPRLYPMSRAVSEAVRAASPAAVVAAAAQRSLPARAREVATGVQGGAFGQPAPYGAPDPIDDEGVDVASMSPLAADSHALEARWRAARDADPMDDPRYADPRYDGRLAGDYFGPRRNGRGG